jgi:hypothetical protein
MTIPNATKYNSSQQAIYTWLVSLGYTVIPLNYEEIGNTEIAKPYIAFDIDFENKSNTLKYASLPKGTVTIFCVADTLQTVVDIADEVSTDAEVVTRDFSIDDIQVIQDFIKESKTYYVKLTMKVSFDGTR